MTHLKCLVFAAALFSLACGGGEEAEVAFVDDIVAAAPDNAKVLLENDSVSVVLFTLPPQGQLPEHEGLDRLVYSLSDYKLQFLRQVGEPEIKDFRKGDVHWHPAGRHAIRNVGPITAEYLVVSRKGENPTPGVTSNLAELMPDKAKVIFENQEAKVIEVSLEPGDKQPVHVAASRVAYSLTPAKLKFTSGEQSTETAYAAGEAHWHDGGEHEVECLSEEPVRYIVFEMM